MKSAVKIAGLIGVLAGISGCAVGPDYQPPEPVVPAAYVKPVSTVPAIDLARWWQALNDPQLNVLVEKAIAGNFDIEIALNRLQQARMQESVVLGSALPQAEADAGGGHGSGSDLSRGRVPSALGAADNTNRMKVIDQVSGFDASWELDFFGRLRRSMEAAAFDAQAADEARNLVLVSVVADVARTYVELRGHQTLAAVLRDNIQAARKSRDFVKLRFERGLINELELTLAERQLASLQAEQAPLEGQIEAAQYTIAVLLGMYPEDLSDLAKPAALPALPERINVGLPLELIQRRPDIRQAENQVAAANARMGVAVAALFPRISITGGIGEQSSGLGLGQASHLWSLGPTAYWPLLDFGTLDAQIEIADRETHRQLVNYKSVICSAVRDVDIAASSFDAQQSRVKKLEDALVSSQRAVMLATKRYDRGLTDFLNVVDAERQKYAIEAEYVLAQQAAATSFVDVYKNLGGGWEDYQPLLPYATPQPALIAMFRQLGL